MYVCVSNSTLLTLQVLAYTIHTPNIIKSYFNQHIVLNQTNTSTSKNSSAISSCVSTLINRAVNLMILHINVFCFELKLVRCMADLRHRHYKYEYFCIFQTIKRMVYSTVFFHIIFIAYMEINYVVGVLCTYHFNSYIILNLRFNIKKG